MDFPGLLLAALLCAEVAAVVLAVRARVSRPVIALLAFALADELAQAALHAALDGAPRPLAGWYRAAWHVSIALSLGWPAALAWCAGTTKVACPGSLPGTDSRLSRASHAPWPARGRCERSTAGEDGGARRVRQALAGAYLGALAGLAVVYPPSSAGLRWTLLAWELLTVLVAWLGLYRRRFTPWGPAEVVLVVLVSCETMIAVVGPFASDPFTRWWIARVFYLGAWGLVCGVLARAKCSA